MTDFIIYKGKPRLVPMGAQELSPGVYRIGSQRFQVLGSGNVLRLRGRLRDEQLADIPEVPEEERSRFQQATSTPGGLARRRRRLSRTRPGGGRQTAIVSDEPQNIDVIEEPTPVNQQRQALQRLESRGFRTEDGGFNLAAALREGTPVSDLQTAGFSEREIAEARDFNVRRRRQAEAQLEERRVDREPEPEPETGMRETPTERHRREGQQERDETPERQLAGRDVSDVPPVDTAEAVTEQRFTRLEGEPDLRPLATPEQREETQRRRMTERADVLARLDRFRADEGGFNVAAAIAAGAVTPSQLRGTFDPAEVQRAERQARSLERAAETGFYAHPSLIPDQLEGALQERIADDRRQLASVRDSLSRQPEGTRGNLPLRQREQRLQTNINRIEGFLSEGGILPDFEVVRRQRDLRQAQQELERVRTRRQTDSPSALAAFGVGVLATQREERRLQQLVQQRRAALREAVERAEPAPITDLRTNPATFAQFARRVPSEAARVAVNEAAQFTLRSAAVGFALRPVGIAARAAGRGIRSAVRSQRAVSQAERARIAENLRLVQQRRRLAQLIQMERDRAGQVGQLSPAAVSPAEEQALATGLRRSLSEQMLREARTTGDVPVERLVAGLTPAERAILARMTPATAANVVVRSVTTGFAPSTAPTEPEVEPADPSAPEPETTPLPPGIDPVVVPSEEPEVTDEPSLPPGVDPVTVPDEPITPAPDEPTPTSPVTPTPVIPEPTFPEPAITEPEVSPPETPAPEVSPPEVPAPVTDDPAPATEPAEEPATEPTPSEDPEVAPLGVPDPTTTSEPATTDEPAPAEEPDAAADLTATTTTTTTTDPTEDPDTSPTPSGSPFPVISDATGPGAGPGPGPGGSPAPGAGPGPGPGPAPTPTDPTPTKPRPKRPPKKPPRVGPDGDGQETPNGDRLPAGEFIERARWVQGNQEITFNVRTGKASHKATTRKGSPEHTFEVLSTTTRPPSDRKHEMGVVDVVVTSRGLSFIHVGDNPPTPVRPSPPPRPQTPRSPRRGRSQGPRMGRQVTRDMGGGAVIQRAPGKKRKRGQIVRSTRSRRR